MSYIREELSDALGDLAAKRADAKMHQQRQRQWVGQQMSELLQDPRWNIYNQHLNALKEPHATRVTSLERSLSTTAYLPPDDMVKLKFDLVREKAALEAFDIAQKLIFTLIEQGKVTE